LSDQSRAFPDRPSLRYLKVEAKRRLSAGEFTTLDHAQLTIAREHGMSSWATLKHHVDAADQALAQLRWLVSRFAAADAPEWTLPAREELRQHFDDRYLDLVPPDWLARLFRTIAAQLRENLTDVRAEPPHLRARAGTLRIEATTEAAPPYRLHQLRFSPLGTATLPQG
jgi:hypothetical protein